MTLAAALILVLEGFYHLNKHIWFQTEIKKNISLNYHQILLLFRALLLQRLHRYSIVLLAASPAAQLFLSAQYPGLFVVKQSLI